MRSQGTPPKRYFLVLAEPDTGHALRADGNVWLEGDERFEARFDTYEEARSEKDQLLLRLPLSEVWIMDSTGVRAGERYWNEDTFQAYSEARSRYLAWTAKCWLRRLLSNPPQNPDARVGQTRRF